MKKYVFSLLLVVTFQVSAATSIQLSDVVTRVSNNNYKVYENAVKVYQSKANIEKARSDLLPKLNIWKIASLVLEPVINPSAILDKITDIAPFLVPGNWFRLQEIKLLYLAEKEGYRALWGNELFVAKTLYKNLLFDQQILEHVQLSIQELERVHVIVKTREAFGGAKPGTARDVEVKILGLKDDERNLKLLIDQEHDELSYMLGYTADTELQLSSIAIPDVATLKTLNVKDYEFKVLSSSPERRQFDHFLSVLGQIKIEIQYSFLGVSEVSRGVAGGVFDSLPIPDGLGFGTGAAIKIVDGQKSILQTQKKGIEEILKRQLKSIGNQYNSDLLNYQNFKRRAELAKESKESILRRLKLGENLDVTDLSEASRNQIQAETALYAVQYRVVNTYDRLERLIFSGDYSISPPLIDSLKGATP